MGRATALLAADRGWPVAINDRSDARAAAQAAAEVQRRGARTTAIRSDVSRSRGGKGGSIVLVSSAATRLGSPGEYVDYAGSKAALDTLAIGLAKELGAEGVRVNAVRPGLIDTEIHATSGDPERARRLGAATPVGRAGRPEEIAEAIVWLLSDTASYVTGALLDVTGGR
ncbi:MAG: SDR family oxidoreductase [Steroidobacteraceae bacterium]